MSGLIASAKGGNFEPMPGGNYIARCVQIIDHGTQFNERYGNSSRKVLIGFEFPTEMKKVGETEEPWLQWRNFTLSLSDGAHLRSSLRAWRGRDFTPEELKGFDLTTILGVPAMVTIEEYTDKEGVERSGISAITPVPKGMAVPDQITPTVKFLLSEFDQALFDTFSEHHQEKIKKSKEYQELFGTPASDAVKKDTSVKSIPGAPRPPKEPNLDDIPFSFLLPFMIGACHVSEAVLQVLSGLA